MGSDRLAGRTGEYTGQATPFQQESRMWVIFLEAGVALVLLLVIVWATWPKRDGTPRKDSDE